MVLTQQDPTPTTDYGLRVHGLRYRMSSRSSWWSAFKSRSADDIGGDVIDR